MQIRELLSRGVVEVIDKEHLETRLRSGRQLRVKFGIDPTGPDIHIGRGATLRKLREFQDLGHTIVFIIGDATARIGDASDKTESRRMLTKEEIERNEENYLAQIGKIIDINKAEIHHNSEWIDQLNTNRWIELASLFTIQQMVQRDNFAERIRKGDPVGYHEGLYPLLQGYDSVIVRADIEIGGTDQLFNLIAGRRIQEYYGQEPQDIMTLQLLAGTDGRKMSTSWGNVILINDPPEEKYGKVMRIADHLIPVYFEASTRVPFSELEELTKALEEGKVNPMELKKRLAFEIVSLYDGEKAADNAQNHFELAIQQKRAPEETPSISVSKPTLNESDFITELVKANLAKSKLEARRFLRSGSIYINGLRIGEEETNKGIQVQPEGIIVRVGKRKYVRFVP